MRKTFCLALAALLPLVSGCDRLADLLDIPDPAKDAANAQAIGSACRQTGRSIEDCYALNPGAQKSAVFSGWKSMNDYMMEHSLKEVPSMVLKNDATAEAPAAGPTVPAVPIPPPPPRAPAGQ